MNLDAIRKKLANLQTATKKGDRAWKPEAGSNVIRIVPYKFNTDYPFIELYFHYGLGGKNYLSPVSFGRPDPIVEFAEKLKSTGSKEDWTLGRKLQPKMRIYAPVIVRGKENEGVKFWGFGKTVYEELLSIIQDPDYGDITDPKSGRDVTVEFTKAASENEYPKTAIRVKPNQTPVTTDKEIISKISDQKEITELYPEPSYEELKDILQKWLESGGDKKSVADGTETTPSQETTNKTNAVKVDDVDAAFDNLFNS